VDAEPQLLPLLLLLLAALPCRLVAVLLLPAPMLALAVPE
jgi:hypothetical protein